MIHPPPAAEPTAPKSKSKKKNDRKITLRQGYDLSSEQPLASPITTVVASARE